MKDSVNAHCFRRLSRFNRYLWSTHAPCVVQQQRVGAFFDGKMTSGSLWTGPGVGESPAGALLASYRGEVQPGHSHIHRPLHLFSLYLWIPGWRLNFMRHKYELANNLTGVGRWETA